MKTLIIFYSRYESTHRAALMIRDRLENCDIIEVELIKNVNLNDYDRIIFGSNIINGKINRKIIKTIKKNKKLLKTKKVYGFILCANKNLYVERYFHLLANLLETNKVYYLGGVLDPARASGFESLLIESIIVNMNSQGLKATGINESAIDEFVLMIKNDQ